MDIATFHASRRHAEVKSGRIAFFKKGQGPVALLVHGVPLNGYHWRNIIDRVQHRRHCIAIDLMALGYTEIGPAHGPGSHARGGDGCARGRKSRSGRQR
jgi:pimeloyl-ACP methyl ester carboxylesterase